MAAIKASEREAKAAQKAKEKEARQLERDTAKVRYTHFVSFLSNPFPLLNTRTVTKAAREAEKSYQRKVANANKASTFFA